MDKETVKDVLRSYLESKDFTRVEVRKIMDNFEKGIDTVKKKRRKKSGFKLRHGTTCLGIITTDNTQRVVEW